MKFVENLDKDTFNKFVKNHPTKSHFLQSYEWGVFSHKEKKLIPYYVGLVDDEDNIIASALLLQKKLPFGYSYFYSPRGYVIDFEDKELLKTFTEELKKFTKKHKSIFVKIDPDIKLQDLDTNGDVVAGTDNFPLISYLKKLGYIHKGFSKNFENSSPRYTFRLDLTKSEDDIFESFHSTTKKILKKGNPYNLEIIKNENAKIEDFYLTMLETEKREGILNHDLNYYKEYYEYLHTNNMSDLYVVKANIEQIKNEFTQKITSLKKEIEKANNKDKYKNEEKRINLQKEFNNQLTKTEKEFEEIKDIKEKTIVLSSIITTKFNDKVWTVHGGNNSILMSLNANYLIYYEIIKDAKKENYKLIDFFGTTGDPKPTNPIYGIHLFKKRLGGEYIEFIGEFDLVTKKFMYFIFSKLIPLYRKVIRKKEKKKREE